MRRARFSILAGTLLLAVMQARAATPTRATLSPSVPDVTWSGGPLTGAAVAPEDCTETMCDAFLLRVDVPRSYWKSAPGGLVIRIEWDDPNDEFDLVVYDEQGEAVGSGIEFHTTSEQVVLFEPAVGTYRIMAHGFAVTAASYRGSARLRSSVTPRAATKSPTMRFAAPTLVDPQMWVAMPSVWASAEGTYVTAPWGLSSTTSFVWRSRDGGRSFELLDGRVGSLSIDPRRRPCSASTGGGDTDVIVDRTGRIYQSDAEAASVAVAYSTDGGDSWLCNAAAASVPEQDRPWLAPSPTADGAGPNVDAYLAYRDLATGALPGVDVVKPLQLHLDATINGGLTWEARSTHAAKLVGATGPLFTARDGTVYQVFQAGTAVWLARSTNEGRHTDLIKVAERLASPANVWMAGDVDEAGTVHLAWADGGSFDIVYSSSLDRGEHWSTPLRVSPPDSETAVMPWVAAGKAGDVAIAWYGTSGRRNPEAASDAAWYAWVARSDDGDSSAPRFETARLSPTPMQFGPICLGGITCSDQRLGEFFEIDIAPDGALVAAFDDRGRIQETTDGYRPGPYVVFVRQVSGLGMRRPVPLVAAETAGDALFPVRSAGARNVGALDFTSVPSAAWEDGALRIEFSLASAADLASALQAADVLATEARWLVVWKARDHVEYAGMRLTRAGDPLFFGGDQPVGVSRPEPDTPNNRIEKVATYPATLPLEGTVDEASGRVSIAIPLERYHLEPGDGLNSLQGFTMTGLGSPTVFTSRLVIDATPSQTTTIGSVAAARAPRTLPRAIKGELPATGEGPSPWGAVLIVAAAALASAGRLRGRRTARPAAPPHGPLET